MKSRTYCWAIVLAAVGLQVWLNDMPWNRALDSAYYSGMGLAIHWFVTSGAATIKGFIHRITA